MITLVLEVKHEKFPYRDFYVPAVSWAKKRCRKTSTIEKNIISLIKQAKTIPEFTAIRIAIYQGVWEYYKNNVEFLGYVNMNLFAGVIEGDVTV